MVEGNTREISTGEESMATRNTEHTNVAKNRKYEITGIMLKL